MNAAHTRVYRALVGAGAAATWTCQPGRSVTVAVEAVARAGVHAGRILSALAVVFLLFDAALEVLKVQPAVEGTAQLGYPENVIVPIGLIASAAQHDAGTQRA